METKNMNRRKFVKLSGFAGATMVLPVEIWGATIGDTPLAIGLITDVHQDIMHDGEQRLQAFIDEANKRKPDFIVQMGDFCRPYDYNRPFMDIFDSFKGDRHHILGNHDTDGGFSRKETRAFWGMPANYYSFDKKGIHFIVLDGNDPNPAPWEGYHRYIGKEQQAWLKEDLSKTNKPTIVLSHQTLELEDGGIANLKEIQSIFETANKAAGFQKVICSLCGHHHTDFMTQINGIYYVQINSASYRWVGSEYKHLRYSEAIDKSHENIKYTIPYKDPLFTFMTIEKDKISLESRKTEFVGPGPDELGMPAPNPHNPTVPTISGVVMKR